MGVREGPWLPGPFTRLSYGICKTGLHAQAQKPLLPEEGHGLAVAPRASQIRRQEQRSQGPQPVAQPT